jgi:hypothetical protein
VRFSTGCLVMLVVLSAPVLGDERVSSELTAPPPSATNTVRAANRLRHAGLGVLLTGCTATLASGALLAASFGWGIGNGLGEHYAQTPDWVTASTNSGWGLFAGGQAAVVSGIVMLSAGTDRRNRALAGLSVSLAPMRQGAMVSLAARF